MADKPRIPTFRVRFESYDDFLVEYGDHLRRGLIVLPLATELDPGMDVRIKLTLPDDAKLFLTGAVSQPAGETMDVTAAEGLVVRLNAYTDEQRAALESCVAGAAGEGEDTREAEEAAGGQRAISLLLVDDSVAVRIELGDALRERGVRVRVAENGLVGIAAALKRPPDIILSDVEMPVMDGWTFLRMARGRKRLSEIPFVFFTRLTDDLSRLQGYRMGVEDYLAKDTPPDEILVRLEGVLARTTRQSRFVDPGTSLRGDLRHVRLGSLLAFLETERRTGELHLVSGSERSILRLEAGILVDVDDLRGFSRLQDRVFELLDWVDGEFEFIAASEVVIEHEVEPAQVTYLLMEHARRADEGQL